MSSTHFNPARYISSSIPKKEPSTILRIKGNNSETSVDVNINDLKKSIKLLREYHQFNPKKLPSDVKVEFEKIVKLVNKLHGTNSYDLLLNLINEHFFDLNKVNINTVGSYFVGGSQRTSFHPDKPECAPIAAGSMPTNNDAKFCHNHVFIAESRSGDNGYDIHLLNRGQDQSHAYLFIRHDNMEDFEGLNDEEKRKIRSYGVEHVYLYGYGDDVTEYKDWNGTALHLDQIKCRPSNNKNNKKNITNWWVVIVVVIILIILLLLLVFYRGSYKNNNPY